jgi:hypothetical protein
MARRERNAPRPAPTIDQVMAEERAATFAKRSIRISTKLAGLKLAVSMMDLTTLEGKDMLGKIACLYRKAKRCKLIISFTLLAGYRDKGRRRRYRGAVEEFVAKYSAPKPDN